jgi:hypothetical protein
VAAFWEIRVLGLLNLSLTKARQDDGQNNMGKEG